MNFTIETDEKPGHVFANGEVYLAAATIVLSEKFAHWTIPRSLKEKFTTEFVMNHDDPFSSTTTGAYSVWFENAIGLEPGSIIVDPSVSFQSDQNLNLWSHNVITNQDNEIPSVQGRLADIFNKPNQISTAYLINNEIVSIANDNGNGTVTIVTEEQYRGRGFATECLSRLIHEYSQLKTVLYCPTKIENAGAVKAAEKCGMKKISLGYWVRVEAEVHQRFKHLIEPHTH